MKCRICGADNTEGAKFCHNCGTALSDVQVSAEPRRGSNGNPAGGPKNAGHERNDTICPFCQAADCQPMQKSTTEIKNQGYKWGSGCCGMLLLGPFGLLCGLCGTGSKIKTENELWWTCMKCGKQHLALADALKRREAVISGLPISGLSMGIAAIILRWLFDAGFFLSAVIIIAAALGLAIATSEAEKEISQELGEPLGRYLTKEQKDHESQMTLIAIGICAAVSLFGIPILNLLLGE